MTVTARRKVTRVLRSSHAGGLLGFGAGGAKLSDLVAATGLFRAETRSPGEGKPGIIYVKDKRRQPPSAKAS